MELKNLKKSVARLKKAIEDKENIILFSDADLDGVSSILLLEEAIKSLGGNVLEIYFPKREKEGYGLNKTSLAKFKKLAPGLLIVSDSGIASFDEVEIAKKMGLDVIIIDHHEILQDKVPDTPYIIDPKQKGDDYPFNLMAACGLCYKFVEELLGSKMSEATQNSFLELVAIGTISDMMPQEQDNILFIEKGLDSIVASDRPGIAVFADFFLCLSKKEFVRKIIWTLQLTNFKDSLTESYLLLKESDKEKAKEMAGKLIDKSINRHSLIKILAERIIDKEEVSASPVVFIESPEIPHLLTGSISSRVCNKLKKPAFIIASSNTILRGSARSPKIINCVEALKACQKHLITFGGHPQAAGFSFERKDIGKFKKCLENFIGGLTS